MYSFVALSHKPPTIYFGETGLYYQEDIMSEVKGPKGTLTEEGEKRKQERVTEREATGRH